MSFFIHIIFVCVQKIGINSNILTSPKVYLALGVSVLKLSYHLLHCVTRISSTLANYYHTDFPLLESRVLQYMCRLVYCTFCQSLYFHVIPLI